MKFKKKFKESYSFRGLKEHQVQINTKFNPGAKPDDLKNEAFDKGIWQTEGIEPTELRLGFLCKLLNGSSSGEITIKWEQQ